jgi:MFS family permease
MKLRRRVAARLGLDGNKLRRRTDKIASSGAALLLAVFLVGAPLLSLAAGRLTDRALAAEQRAQRGWHQVTAVLIQDAPFTISYGWAVASWAMARWTAPAGHHRVGLIEAVGGTPAGTRIRIWVDPAGRWAGPPLRRPVAQFLVAGAIAAASAALAVTLLGVAYVGRRRLDRRRLAAWEAAWTSVGPQWTRQYRAPG